MASVSAFYTSSETVISQRITDSVKESNLEDIHQVYEIERCISWITGAGYQRVALQFPDELMPDAVTVTNIIQKAVDAKTTVFILGDTSYGSCCVDEVAAQHYNASAIIHYGRSCLSEPCKMPTLFVFGRQPLDVSHCVTQIQAQIPDTATYLILVCDTTCAYASGDVAAALNMHYPNLVVADLHMKTTTENSSLPKDDILIQKCGRHFVIPSEKSLKDYTVIFIGKESLTLNNILFNFQPKELYSYDPEMKFCRKENFNVNKLLMKRYFLIEKAKDANIIGILVGTLGVANYSNILTRLKSMIKKAGKKSYVFIVGKINVAKLANFMEIDIFVLIACSENTLLDSSEFYKPVITPYEMEIACNLREWTGEYPTDFSQLLQGGCEYVPIPDEIERDETDISLITGRMRHLQSTGDNVDTATTVAVRSDLLTVANQAETAGQFLEMRSWKGLEQQLGETPVTKAVEGQKGIAMGYTNEPETAK